MGVLYVGHKNPGWNVEKEIMAHLLEERVFNKMAPCLKCSADLTENSTSPGRDYTT